VSWKINELQEQVPLVASHGVSLPDVFLFVWFLLDSYLKIRSSERWTIQYNKVFLVEESLFLILIF